MVSKAGEAPLIGIFWGVQEKPTSVRIVVDTTPADQGESYGDFLTHAAGHLDVWEAWRRFGPAGLVKRGLPQAIAWHEYEYFPRGRVVYHCPTKRFIVYADKVLQAGFRIEEILRAFRLTREQCDIRSDTHYRSGTSLSAS